MDLAEFRRFWDSITASNRSKLPPKSRKCMELYYAGKNPSEIGEGARASIEKGIRLLQSLQSA